MRKKLLFIAFALFASLNVLAQDIKVVPGETFTMDISMDNEEEVCAWQAKVVLPEGIDLVRKGTSYAVKLSDRHSPKYSLQVFRNSENSNEYTIIAFSTSLSPLSGNSGAVATLTLRASTNFNGESTVHVINQSQSTMKGKSLKVSDKSRTIISDATAIETINADALKGKEVFNLSGQRVTKPTSRFVYIVDGKKVLIK
jgi:hypothetical protein